MAMTIDQIKDATTRGTADPHWFEPATLRFFSSRVLPVVRSAGDGLGQYFVTSERSDDDSDRRYTVRRFDPSDASISNAPGHHFLEFATPAQAMSAARLAADAERDALASMAMQS